MRTIFTCPQIAALVGIAPRTVRKWFDAGRLRGYRIPGTQDIRVPREHLIRFAEEHGFTNVLRKLEEEEKASKAEETENERHYTDRLED